MTTGKNEPLFRRFVEKSVNMGNLRPADGFIGGNFISHRSAERGLRAHTASTLRSINGSAASPVSGGMERVGGHEATPVLAREVPAEGAA